MNKKVIDVVVIGGGPAGMSAALSAYENGAKDILIIERDDKLGGVLGQCIHSGFGLHRFKEELTGPEYSERYEDLIAKTDIDVLLDTMVLSIDKQENGEFCIVCSGKEEGLATYMAKAVVLATGCRERSRGALSIPGDRPAGVYSAGTVQKMVNIMGLMPGKETVILGSGDIGLIMARRMTLEGANVKAVCELMPDSGGLTRNIIQCLYDFDIPLYIGHTVTKIHGRERLEGVTISEVDENLKPIKGSERYIPCDTLLLSVGLIPETEVAETADVSVDQKKGGVLIDENRQTSVSGIFACGNVTRVHELADLVSIEGEAAGKAAALYVQGIDFSGSIKPAEYKEQKKGIKILEQTSSNVVICTSCPNGCAVELEMKDGEVISCKGNLCKRGEAFAKAEITNPVRVLTSTVRTSDGNLLPVRSSKPVPKDLVKDIVKMLSKCEASGNITIGDVVLENVLDTGADIIAAKSHRGVR